MQYNHIISLKKVRNNRVLATAIKVLIFLFVTAYIFYSLRSKNDFDTDYKNVVMDVFAKYHYWLFLPVLLFPVNWAIEAIKWKYLTSKIEKISFWRSFRGILTGVTLGFATPLGLGDYAGRILQLNSPDRAKSLGAVFTSRIAQFYITLVCGSTSLIFLAFKTKNLDYFDNSFDVFVFFILLTNVIFISLLLFHKRILEWLGSRKIVRKAYSYIQIINEYSDKELAYVLALSFIRYLVFTSQFVLVLYFFGISNNIGILLLGVNFIFLVKSVIPTFFDLGVRESAAVYFFSHMGFVSDKIVVASLSLWAINILFPALIGLFLVFRLKIFSDR